MCEMEGVFTNYDYQEIIRNVEEHTSFFDYLQKHGIKASEIKKMSFEELKGKFSQQYDTYKKA